MSFQFGHGAEAPSSWVTRYAPVIPKGSRVLDVACGRGRHALLLARQGCQVEAVDNDPECARALRGHVGIRFLRADLEQGDWPFEPGRFDVIIVTNFLYRPLFPRLAEGLANGGLLLYETFAVGNEQFGKPSNPDFLLRPRELIDAFPSLRVLAYEDGILREPRLAAVQRLAARRVEQGAVLPVEAFALITG